MRAGAPTNQCRRGIHACGTATFRGGWPMSWWEIELDGEPQIDEHKIVAPAGALRSKIDGWTAACAQEYGEACGMAGTGQGFGSPEPCRAQPRGGPARGVHDLRRSAGDRTPPGRRRTGTTASVSRSQATAQFARCPVALPQARTSLRTPRSGWTACPGTPPNAPGSRAGSSRGLSCAPMPLNRSAPRSDPSFMTDHPKTRELVTGGVRTTPASRPRRSRGRVRRGGGARPFRRRRGGHWRAGSWGGARLAWLHGLGLATTRPSQRLGENGIDLIRGSPPILDDAWKVEVAGYWHIVLATGSEPVIPLISGPDQLDESRGHRTTKRSSCLSPVLFTVAQLPRWTAAQQAVLHRCGGSAS